jgi:hypothetical protein
LIADRGDKTATFAASLRLGRDNRCIAGCAFARAAPINLPGVRVSTDGQSVAAQGAELKKAGADKVFREVASGAKTERAQLRRLINHLSPGDVVLVTRLDRLARSTRDLLNALAAVARC